MNAREIATALKGELSIVELYRFCDAAVAAFELLPPYPEGPIQSVERDSPLHDRFRLRAALIDRLMLHFDALAAPPVLRALTADADASLRPTFRKVLAAHMVALQLHYYALLEAHEALEHANRDSGAELNALPALCMPELESTVDRLREYLRKYGHILP